VTVPVDPIAVAIVVARALDALGMLDLLARALSEAEGDV
jgi:hypothetical protein